MKKILPRQTNEQRRVGIEKLKDELVVEQEEVKKLINRREDNWKNESTIKEITVLPANSTLVKRRQVGPSLCKEQSLRNKI